MLQLVGGGARQHYFSLHLLFETLDHHQLACVST